MRWFTCLLDPEARGVSSTLRGAYEALPRSRGLTFRWWSAGAAVALTAWDDPHAEPLTATNGHHCAAGIVRLDNRADLERWSASAGCGLTDLELVLGTVARHGIKYIPEILGDFSFVVWDTTTRTAVAACDTFAVQKLYYATSNGRLAFASRAEALALGEQYDARYLAGLVHGSGPPRELSVYAGVRPVPAASLALVDGQKLSIHRYWHPAAIDAEPAWAKSSSDAANVCRQLLVESVRLRLSTDGKTWAELSGGLDSSSVVSLVQWLAKRGVIENGLAGTATFLHDQGAVSDEREYANVVADHWGVNNTAIVDPPMWHDERYALPHTDQPRLDIQFYPRERRLCALVQANQGRVLLTGWGGDELFTGNMLFFADWLTQGRVGETLREMLGRAAIGHVSFWQLAYWSAVMPFLPSAMRRRLMQSQGGAVPWLKRSTIRKYGLDAHAPMESDYAGPVGSKYRHAVLMSIAAIESLTDHSVTAESLDIRHPFLYRPLVDFALQLPPELCIRPHARKWVLREAMRGILPDLVRTRVGKGDTGDFVARSLAKQRAQLEPLVRQSALADLGIIDPMKLRAAFDAVPRLVHSNSDIPWTVHTTLAVEAWLQIRSGRWPRGAIN